MRLVSILSIVVALVCAAPPARADEDQPLQRDQTPPQEQSKLLQPNNNNSNGYGNNNNNSNNNKSAKKKPPKPYEPKEPTPIRDRTNQFEIVVHNYEWLKQQHIVMQKRDFSCGAAAVATIAHYYWGDNVDEDLFLRALDTILTDAEIEDRIKNGLAMSDLRRAAVIAGYEAVVGKLTFDKLPESKVRLVVGIKPGGHKHFVVYRGTDWVWVYVADPIRGNLRMPIKEFVDQWQEKAVLVIGKPGAKIKETSPLSLTEADLRFGETTKQYIRSQAPFPPEIKQPLR